MEVCHRIVEILPGSPPSFVTQGDHLAQADSVVIPARDVVGRVGFSLPVAGRALPFLRSLAGLLICLIAPAVLVTLLCLYSLRQEVLKLKNQLKGRRISPG